MCHLLKVVEMLWLYKLFWVNVKKKRIGHGEF